jgi:3-oxoacyl-[acyl-carrier protein] reductase
MDISGSKILVTGGASGMGRAFTLNLAKLGGDVAFCDLSEEGIAEVEAAAADLPGKVKGFVANVADEDDVVALV